MADWRRVPRLMLVTDHRRSVRPLPELVAAAVAGGVDAVQIREHDLSGPDLRALAERLRAVIAGRATLLVNSDLTLAVELGLGLHLPEAGIATAEARRRLGDLALLGRSVHSPAAATASAGVDYLIAGNVYETASKPGHPPLGLPGLSRIATATWSPVLAIGGITARRVPEVIAAGAHGVAVVGAIAGSADPERAAAALRAAIAETVGDEEMEETQPDEALPVAIVVNGKPIEVEPGTTVTDFLIDKGFRDKQVVVELNGVILARRAFDETEFRPGDRVEMVHAVGGG